MSGIQTGNISAFGVVNEAEQQLLTSEAEEQKVRKSSVNDKKEVLQKHREERIDNLQDRIKMLGQGQSGCLKFLKIITLVGSALSAPFTFGSSLGLSLAITSAIRIASAVLTGVGAITSGLEQLKEAMREKKILLNKSEGQQILALISETEKWIEDEKSQLTDSNRREKESLDEYKQTLKDLEGSFQSMIYV